jgi:hypothetical protein
MNLAVGFNPRDANQNEFRRVATIESTKQILLVVIDTMQFQYHNVFVLECLLPVMIALILYMVNEV